MINTDKAGRRRFAALAGVLAALVAVALASLALASRPGGGAGAPEPAKLAACAGAGTAVGDSSPRAARRAVRCLVNRERAGDGLARLARNSMLERVARKHSKTMVATDCLAHECPGEADLETRVQRSGYLDGARAWRFAENTGCGIDAKAMVESWLESESHRANLLNRKLRDIGVGVVDDAVATDCAADHATFTVVLGWRKLGS